MPSQACGAANAPAAVSGGAYPHCPTYDLTADGTFGAVYANGDLQFQLTVHVPDETQYLVWDEPSMYGRGEYIFAIWHYFEGNGLPGLQRGDKLCYNTPDGYESDYTIC